MLNSNGTLLDRWDNINKILESPLRRFILSLDGLSKETFALEQGAGPAANIENAIVTASANDVVGKPLQPTPRSNQMMKSGGPSICSSRGFR